MSKSPVVARPLRDPDHVSKRGVPYWFSPEWVRGTGADTIVRPLLMMNPSGQMTPAVKSMPGFTSRSDGTFFRPAPSYQKIKAIREKDTANLYMVAKSGKLNYIQGSIQKEFKDWHNDRQIDYILLGETPESASELIVNETEEQ